VGNFLFFTVYWGVQIYERVASFVSLWNNYINLGAIDIKRDETTTLYQAKSKTYVKDVTKQSSTMSTNPHYKTTSLRPQQNTL
jgi:hypothetical protein